ncbi:MAG: hypothetical protein CMP11_08485 [Zetaproteobacteria bacterium]|nr:hypothetical protein [Pseudobdellovibrionaceae bacterium]
MKINKKNIKGFSLVELMVVIAIIGILSSLAIPRFRVFQAKARQTEAKTNLSYIYTLETSYQGDYDTYADMAPHGYQGGSCSNTCEANELGFMLQPCSSKSRYCYEVNGAAATTFTATATSGDSDANTVNPGCPADIWTITEERILGATFDSVRSCNQ